MQKIPPLVNFSPIGGSKLFYLKANMEGSKGREGERERKWERSEKEGKEWRERERKGETESEKMPVCN